MLRKHYYIFNKDNNKPAFFQIILEIKQVILIITSINIIPRKGL